MVWREGGVWIWPTFVVAASFNDAPSSTLSCHFHPNPLSHALALLVSGPDKCKNHANYRNMRKHTPQLLATLAHKSCQSQKKKSIKNTQKKENFAGKPTKGSEEKIFYKSWGSSVQAQRPTFHCRKLQNFNIIVWSANMAQSIGNCSSRSSSQLRPVLNHQSHQRVLAKNHKAKKLLDI